MLTSGTTGPPKRVDLTYDMLARSVLGLLPSGTRREGSLRLAGQDLDALDATGRRRLVGRRIGYVPQSYGSHTGEAIRVRDAVTLAVQVNGKLRGTIEVTADAPRLLRMGA